MRGWWRLYATSVGLGLRHLTRHGYLREAVVRTVIPLDPVRYVELPWALRALAAVPGERVLDLASPKLLAVALARSGVHVTSVDELPPEIEAWRRLTRGERNLELVVADGRALPFADASFDHATSISVLEHVADDGDATALGELARCVRPGGRIAITLPFARRAWDEYRREAAYVDRGGDERGHFFQRWYDDERVDALLARVPELRLRERTVVRLVPNWHRAYTRAFPWLVPLGPLYGVLAVERAGEGGDVVRLLLERARS
ncbi:MAG TPA: class I SAM-dependent methyltransferase [Gaiellaceae bacterium]|nr:class I SAM-dependent methyltransferase [Gaiellaceae bacterium]